MPKFSDTKGDSWPVHVSFSKARQLATVLGVDVFNMQDLTSLTDSIGVRLEYLFHLCAERAAELEVDDLDAFAARLQSEQAANEASDTLQEALVSFFRRLGQSHLAMVAEKSLALVRQQREQMRQPEFLAELDAQLGLPPQNNGAPPMPRQKGKRQKAGKPS